MKVTQDIHGCSKKGIIYIQKKYHSDMWMKDDPKTL